MVFQLELDILECKVKWTLGNITTNKASGGDRMPAELFQILKVMLLKCCTHYSVNLENSQVATGLEKISFHSNPKEGKCKRKVQITAQLNSFHMLAKSCKKFFKPGFNSVCIENFQMFKLDLEKAEKPEIK